MKKEIIYRYFGTNGAIESPVHLEGVYNIRLYSLVAEKGHVLTNGEVKLYSVRVPEENVSLWTEVIDDQVR